jgi:hypothetical protein
MRRWSDLARHRWVRGVVPREMGGLRARSDGGFCHRAPNPASPPGRQTVRAARTAAKGKTGANSLAFSAVCGAPPRPLRMSWLSRPGAGPARLHARD